LSIVTRILDDQGVFNDFPLRLRPSEYFQRQCWLSFLQTDLTGCGKTPRSPFDKLRANGTCLEIIEDFPLVLSLSKHENHFFSTLLRSVLD